MLKPQRWSMLILFALLAPTLIIPAQTQPAAAQTSEPEPDITTLSTDEVGTATLDPLEPIPSNYSLPQTEDGAAVFDLPVELAQDDIEATVCRRLLVNPGLTNGFGWTELEPEVFIEPRAFYSAPNSFLMQDGDDFSRFPFVDTLDAFGQPFVIPRGTRAAQVEFKIALFRPTVFDRVTYAIYKLSPNRRLVEPPLDLRAVEPFVDRSWRQAVVTLDDESILAQLRGQPAALVLSLEGDGASRRTIALIDDVQITACGPQGKPDPLPTIVTSPIPTPSDATEATRTPRPTRTATSTPSSTGTAGPTLTASPSGTATQIPSPTLPPCPAPSATPSITRTPSATAILTGTATVTATASTTTTVTATASTTTTVTATASPTTTLTPTVTLTPTATLTPTILTPSPTWTPTLTPSPSGTSTTTTSTTFMLLQAPTETASPTPTPALTVTVTATPTGSVTATTTPTGNATVTPTTVLTVTATPTGTTTVTPTPTPALTVTVTPTGSATVTPTLPLTVTATPTGTQTATPTSVLTVTTTPTGTVIATPTGTPCAPFVTATPSVTGTPPTATPSRTAGPTRTPSITTTPPTATPSRTAGPTRTANPTRTPGGDNDDDDDGGDDDFVDSDFLPNPDGYRFANYGFSPFVEFTVADMREMLGDAAACKRVLANGRCIVRPSAEQWRKTVNLAMQTTGHSYGFSVSSQRFFRTFDKPGDFQIGATRTFQLAKSRKTQSNIAYFYATQFVDPVASAINSARRNDTPSETLEKLIDSLESDPFSLPVVAIYQRGRGAHALTPYYIEQVEDGIYNIYVYDSNFPDDDSRYIEVNLDEDTWSYNAGPRLGRWGNYRVGTFIMVPLSLHNGPFKLRQREQRQPQIWGGGDVSPDLLIRDAQGRRLGFVGEQYFGEIPGAFVTQPIGGLGRELPPVFTLPSSEPIIIIIDGRRLIGGGLSLIRHVGPEFVISLRLPRFRIGGECELRIGAGGRSATVRSLRSGNDDDDDDLAIAQEEITEADLAISQDSAGYDVELRGLDLAASQAVTATVDANGSIVVDAASVGAGSYNLTLSGENDAGEPVIFNHDNLALASGDKQYIDVQSWDGKGPLTVRVDRGGDGTIDETLQLSNQLKLMHLPFLSRPASRILGPTQ